MGLFKNPFLYSRFSTPLVAMRVTFHPPSVKEFSLLFQSTPGKSLGGGLSDIRVFSPPRLHQRGGGLFSFLTGLAKKATPFLLKTIAPAALDFGKNVIEDVAEGRSDLKTALRRRGVESLKEVGGKTVKRVLKRGGGRSRRRAQPVKRLTRRRRGNKNDVFSLL